MYRRAQGRRSGQPLALHLGIVFGAVSFSTAPSRAKTDGGTAIASDARDRVSFAGRLSTVRERLAADRVREILGPPDDIRREGIMGTKERWCYGTSGHLTFPTLGEVYIDEKGTVQFVYGGQGQPPPAGMFRSRSFGGCCKRSTRRRSRGRAAITFLIPRS